MSLHRTRPLHISILSTGELWCLVSSRLGPTNWAISLAASMLTPANQHSHIHRFYSNLSNTQRKGSFFRYSNTASDLFFGSHTYFGPLSPRPFTYTLENTRRRSNVFYHQQQAHGSHDRCSKCQRILRHHHYTPLTTFLQARTTKFGDFNSAPSRHTHDDRTPQTSTIGQTFGNGGAWQSSSGIWGGNPIGSGFANTKRDASRSRGMSARGAESRAVTDVNTAAGNDEFPGGPSGSGALAASSEADPWGARANAPWNPPDTTSPTLQSSHSGSTPPAHHVRTNMPSTATQSLLEIQNSYTQSRPAIGQGAGFNRSQHKSSLDPSSGSFKFSRRSSFGFNDDKENSGQFPSNTDNSFDMDISSRPFRADQMGPQNTGFLGIGNGSSRDSSMPPSRASDSGLNGSGLAFGNNNQAFGSIGHTPNNSIHSHRQSFSNLSGAGAFPSQANGSRFTDLNQTEVELREKFGALGFGSDGEPTNASQANSNLGTSYSPNHPNYTHNYQANGGSAMWNDTSSNPKGSQNYETYSGQAFADQPYFSKGHRFSERASVSPAGSDYRRGVNSPKYYSATGTPVGSDQIYRPGSRGPRIPQGPSELDRRLQNAHYPQTQFLYNHPFQGQYPPPAYEYAPPFRQGAVPYGYPIALHAYPQAQIIPTRPSKDQDVGVGVRSVLLEEFRSNSKSNKRYELKVRSRYPH